MGRKRDLRHDVVDVIASGGKVVPIRRGGSTPAQELGAIREDLAVAHGMLTEAVAGCEALGDEELAFDVQLARRAVENAQKRAGR